MAVTKKKRTIKRPPYRGSISEEEARAVVSAVHVFPEEMGWVVRKIGGGRASRCFENRGAAVRYARQLGDRSGEEVILHHGDGRVTRHFR